MRIGIVGCAGRMGRMLVGEVAETAGAELAGGTEAPGGAAVGRDILALAGAGEGGPAVGDDPAALFAAADVVIDFTVPDATALHARLAGEHGTAHVIGTTGLDDDHRAAIAEAARRVPVVQAPNMSLGVNLLFALVEKVSAALDEDWDIEILEMHHRHKRDAPSGTALGLGAAAAHGRGIQLEEAAERVRDGHTGERARGAIGFATLRGGDVVGEHAVTFAGAGERIEIGHKAGSRRIFARGAVRAALWCAGRTPGHYHMRDVLGIG